MFMLLNVKGISFDHVGTVPSDFVGLLSNMEINDCNKAPSKVIAKAIKQGHWMKIKSVYIFSFSLFCFEKFWLYL